MSFAQMSLRAITKPFLLQIFVIYDRKKFYEFDTWIDTPFFWVKESEVESELLQLCRIRAKPVLMDGPDPNPDPDPAG